MRVNVKKWNRTVAYCHKWYEQRNLDTSELKVSWHLLEICFSDVTQFIVKIDSRNSWNWKLYFVSGNFCFFLYTGKISSYNWIFSLSPSFTGNFPLFFALHTEIFFLFISLPENFPCSSSHTRTFSSLP